MWKVQLFELNYDDREPRAVRDVVESGWITMGQQTLDFEAAFEDLLGHGHCTAVSSCTAALHMSMMALDIGPGDEVIVPALTFIAAANAVRLVGATPVLSDCASHDDWNSGVEQIRARIGPRTKAITCVHYGGYPCEMDALVELAREHDLALVEDVAHAPGGLFRGRALGTWGDIGCFSFFTNKNLSVGEGGMLVTEDPELNQRLRHLRSHGMTTLTLDRHEGRAITYDVVRPGLNYRIDEMRAALGLVQLDKLAAGNAERRRLTRYYRQRLEQDDRVHVPFAGVDSSDATYHIFPVLLAAHVDRDAVVRALKARGVQASIHYPSIPSFQAYSDMVMEDCPVANHIARQELTLPLFPTMGDEKVDIVCNALVESLDEVTA